MSKRLLAFTISWPIVVVALAISLQYWLGRPSQVPGPQSRPRQEQEGPAGVVHRLWDTQERITGDLQALLGANEAKRLLTKNAQNYFLQGLHTYSDRQVDTEEQIGPDRWKISATFTVSPMHQEDGKASHRRQYIVCKDAGAWKIDEVWVECPRCEGQGSRVCFMCEGTGRTKYTRAVCSECNGSGKLKCESCKGVGRTNLIKESYSLADY